MNIRELKKTDRIEYIELISSFRPLDISISEEIFNKIYDEIFKTDIIIVCELVQLTTLNYMKRIILKYIN